MLQKYIYLIVSILSQFNIQRFFQFKGFDFRVVIIRKGYTKNKKGVMEIN